MNAKQVNNRGRLLYRHPIKQCVGFINRIPLHTTILQTELSFPSKPFNQLATVLKSHSLQYSDATFPSSPPYLDHSIDVSNVTELDARPEMHGMRRAAHRFHAARHDGVGVAVSDGLKGVDDCT